MIDEPVDDDAVETPAERGRSLRRAAMLTAGVGMVFSVLFTVALYLVTSVPGGRSTDEEIREYYRSEALSTATTVGLYIMPFAGIAFIWFSVALRMWAAASERRLSILHSNLQFVSGIAFVLLMFVASASMAVVAVSFQLGGGTIDTDAARQFWTFGVSLTLFFAMRMAAMFVFTTSAIGRSAGILPRWFVFLGFILGAILLLSATFSPVLVLAFPGWVLVLSLILLRGARQIPADVRLPPGMGAADPVGAMLRRRTSPPAPQRRDPS
jgi:hypothetical protein